MNRTAIISDIHANLEAFEAVLADIEAQSIGDIVCLGDVVGYGPNPCECIDLVEKRCSVVIRGNHDDAAIHGPLGFNRLAHDAISWTQKVLRPKLLRPGTRQRWNFLDNLPRSLEWNGFLLVHGSPRDPTSEYIMDRDVMLGNETMFEEIFEAFERVCFVGHTHMPGVFRESLPRTTWMPQAEIEGSFRHEGTKMVVNVGSVGQPRDRDPRSCYLTADPGSKTFEFRRVPYDVDTTQAKIRRISQLDNGLADRLTLGV